MNNKRLLWTLLPFIDTTLQAHNGKEWVDIDKSKLDDWRSLPDDVRLKPLFRPFESMRMCMAEMAKHKPYGWVSLPREPYCLSLVGVGTYYVAVENMDGGVEKVTFQDAARRFRFLDGEPFGLSSSPASLFQDNTDEDPTL